VLIIPPDIHAEPTLLAVLPLFLLPAGAPPAGIRRKMIARFK
jgi:hypothetical protein